MQLRVVRKSKREETAKAMSQPPRATRPDDVVGETTDIVSSLDNISFLGLGRMDNLLKAHI
ncbi:hypothetical protein SAMN02990966_05412 [Rhodospirillales bacterium URHD0017]|nr:hypothetical protein SAMN02990966_05412 [Rhodospirillales bacterium URHD0017]